MVILFTLITFLSTLAGGLFALRFKSKLHLILGFSAGAVIGVCFFDLLPEAFSLCGNEYSPQIISSVVALGFLLYLLLDRITFLPFPFREKQMERRGDIGAGSLSLHSFFDGVAIGLAFQVSYAAGILVAVAVIAHDFSDGLNTVTLVLMNKGDSRRARRWLLIDSIMPVLGVVSTIFFHLPQTLFALALALLSGFFLYIGASDLLPSSQRHFPSLWTTVMTIAGAALMFFAVHYIAV